MKLTAIVLCKNAESSLKDCLNSLTFCDEIIVADDGSADDSVKIAKTFGAKIFLLKPTDSFAAKRNQALAQVTDGYVLFIDADEVVEPELALEIKSKIDLNLNGYFLKRQDLFLGKLLKRGEAGQMYLVRLAKVGTGTWERDVHETWRIKGEIGKIEIGVIKHNPHPTLTSFLDKINTYTSLEITERTKHSVPSLFVAWLQLFIFPGAKFLLNYFFKLGFLDGREGFINAYFMSLHSLLVRIKILEYVYAHS